MNRPMIGCAVVWAAMMVVPAGPAIAAFLPPEACSVGILAMPDRSAGRVLAFSRVDGSLITPSLIPNDGRLIAPKDVVCTSYSILVSDQATGSVLEYSFEGNFIRTLIDGPAAGLADTRGLDIFDNSLYLAVGGGPAAGTIQRFNLDGTGQTPWATDHLDGPNSIVRRESDFLITSAATNSVERFDVNGQWLGRWTMPAIPNPEQLALGFNDEIIVASGAIASGVHTFNIDGEQIDQFFHNDAVHGVYQLLNGNILFTDGASVHVLNPELRTTFTVYSDGDFQYIKTVLIPTPGAATVLALLVCGGFRRQRRASASNT